MLISTLTSKMLLDKGCVLDNLMFSWDICTVNHVSILHKDISTNNILPLLPPDWLTGSHRNVMTGRHSADTKINKSRAPQLTKTCYQRGREQHTSTHAKLLLKLVSFVIKRKTHIANNYETETLFELESPHVTFHDGIN